MFHWVTNMFHHYQEHEHFIVHLCSRFILLFLLPLTKVTNEWTCDDLLIVLQIDIINIQEVNELFSSSISHAASLNCNPQHALHVLFKAALWEVNEGMAHAVSHILLSWCGGDMHFKDS